MAVGMSVITRQRSLTEIAVPVSAGIIIGASLVLGTQHLVYFGLMRIHRRGFHEVRVDVIGTSGS
jgi:hypothetical protein